MLAVALLVVALPTLPEVPVCKGALTPSVKGGCGGVTSFGCCDATGRALWCEGKDLFCLDCTDGFEACGWNPVGYYDCGQAPGSEDPGGAHAAACSACPAECAGVCLDDGTCYTPQCAGKSCGKDPKGYSCGTCAPGFSCVAGLDQCLPYPSGCTAKDAPGCDGCGCEACVCAKFPGCCASSWDALCATACTKDCGQGCSPCPKDPTCDGIECGEYCGLTCGACGEGQVCTGFKCCTPSCDGKECGGDGCGGSCGACKGLDSCEAGLCVPCKPACDGLACGDDGCGGECGACGEGLACVAGECISGASCLGQCGGSADACFCDAQCFASGDCCPDVCAVCPETSGCCVPQCEGKACGPDGCGGNCGPCEAPDACEAGQCIACVPQCAGKQCGDDGCFGDCGPCVLPALCVDDACCTPNCDGKTCGDDGCGGSCGKCKTGHPCTGGQCGSCTPNCVGKGCGSDGCGDECGACIAGETCNHGVCVPEAGCGSFGAIGCCAGASLFRCEAAELTLTPCPGPCGWDAGHARFACGQSGIDLTGENPYFCAHCPAACAGKACGVDKCVAECGTCPAGELCGRDGKCKASLAPPPQGEGVTAVESDAAAPVVDVGTATVAPSEPSGGCAAAPRGTAWVGLLLLLALLRRRTA